MTGNIKWKCAAKAALFSTGCAVVMVGYIWIAALLQNHWLCLVWIFSPVFIFIGVGAYQHCASRVEE